LGQLLTRIAAVAGDVVLKDTYERCIKPEGAFNGHKLRKGDVLDLQVGRAHPASKSVFPCVDLCNHPHHEVGYMAPMTCGCHNVNLCTSQGLAQVP
jgi:hypothetical protein